jgi:hypothetical protein
MRPRRAEPTIKVLLLSLIIGTLLFPASRMRAQAPTGVPSWRVWEKISPCQDTRQDWFTVAQTYPGESVSTNAWQYAEGPFFDFAAAMAAADTRKMAPTIPTFKNRCCNDWAVFKKFEEIRDARGIRTGFYKESFSVGRQSPNQPPQPIFLSEGRLELVQGGLCCEEAFNMAGMPVGQIRDCRNLQLSTGATVTLQPNGTFAPAPGSTSGASAPGTIIGTWTSPTGDTLELRQNGNRITGTYRGPLGTGDITGTFDGKNLSGTFQPSQALIPVLIPFTLTLVEDGKLVGRLETPLGNSPLTLTKPGGTTGANAPKAPGSGSGGQDIDLSGTWRSKQFVGEYQCDSEEEWVLSRVAPDKWQGRFTQVCNQRPSGVANPNLGSSGQVTLQIIGPGKVRRTIKMEFIGTGRANNETSQADGTYTNSEITFGDPSQGPPLKYTRR